MLTCFRFKMCISCCFVVLFGLVVEVFISFEQHSSAPSATPGLLGVMALPWALPWRLSSSDVRTGCQPGRRSVDLCLDSLDDEPSLLTVTDLLRMSTASTWWRTRITLRCHCEQAVLLRSCLLRRCLESMRPTIRWTPEERRCDGLACTNVTDEWMQFHLREGYPGVASIHGSQRIEVFRYRHPQYRYVVCSVECGARLKARLLACADHPSCVILSARYHPAVDLPGDGQPG